MNNRYQFTFSWRVKLPKGKFWEGESTMNIDATNPVSAISEFHKRVQLSRQLDPSNRTVTLRPTLRADEYSVKSFTQIYHDAHKNLVRSAFDYPQSPNPDLQDHHGKRLEGGHQKGEEYAELDLGSAKGVAKSS